MMNGKANIGLPLDVEDLCRRVCNGDRFIYRHFYGHKARSSGNLSNAVFSQFYPCRFEIHGQTFNWSEQWMMAGKAKLFGDNRTLEDILAAETPYQCKQLGRKVRNFDEGTWKNVRFDLVTAGNIGKFEQNEGLKNCLLSTGDEILVEASPLDGVWGIGLDRSDPNANNPLHWRGLSLLGFALIRTRAVLRGELERSKSMPF